MHGGGPAVTPGKPLDAVYTEENLELLEKGCANLGKHIENAKKFGIKVVVAVNQFSNDTPAELKLVQDYALKVGADAAVPANHWARGGEGAVQLAHAVIEACKDESKFDFLYDVNLGLEEKMNIIAKEMYGADGVELSEDAKAQVATYTRQGELSATLRSLLTFQVTRLCPSVWPRPPSRCPTTLPKRVSLLVSLFRMPSTR